MSKEEIFICGGVVSESEFAKDPWRYSLCVVLPDDKFEEWEKTEDLKEKEEILRRYGFLPLA